MKIFKMEVPFKDVTEGQKFRLNEMACKKVSGGGFNYISSNLDYGKLGDDTLVTIECNYVHFEHNEIETLSRIFKNNKKTPMIRQLGLLLERLQLGPKDNVRKKGSFLYITLFSKVEIGEDFMWKGIRYTKNSKHQGKQVSDGQNIGLGPNVKVEVDRIPFSNVLNGELFTYKGIQFRKQGNTSGITENGDIKEFPPFTGVKLLPDSNLDDIQVPKAE